VSDINGDGIPDLITNNDANVSMFFGNGDGTFRLGPTFIPTGLAENGGYLAVADLNGDGKIDLVIGGVYFPGGNGISVSLGNGDGTFSPSVFYSTGSDIAGTPLVEDFNGSAQIVSVED
jgi:hypothetical protein